MADEHIAPEVGSSPTSRIQLASGVLIVAGLIGGWIYTYSAQSSAVADTIRRVTSMEQQITATNSDERDIIVRLGRIEGKIEVMLTRVGGK